MVRNVRMRTIAEFCRYTVLPKLGGRERARFDTLSSSPDATRVWCCRPAAVRRRVPRDAQMRYPMGALGQAAAGSALGRQPRTSGGRLAQRESASFTPRRSLVRSQYRPPSSAAGCDLATGLLSPWCSSKDIPGLGLSSCYG